MGKFLAKAAVFAFGAGVALYGAESASPGSSAPVMQAGVNAGDNVIQGAGQLVNTGVQTVIPVAANAMTSVRNSGLGAGLLTPDTTATAPGAVPPAAVPPAATPQQ
jgi:hypothetical protein